MQEGLIIIAHASPELKGGIAIALPRRAADMWPSVEERIASAVAAALLNDRTERRERRRLRHAAQSGRTVPSRSRSPPPRPLSGR